MKAWKPATTREEQIEAFLDDVENWDHDTLVDRAKDDEEKRLEAMSDEELAAEYRGYFGDDD